FIERTVDQAGEVVEVHGLLLCPGAHVDQFGGRGIVEPEMALEPAVELVAFGRVDPAIDGGGMDQQRGGSQPIIVLRKAVWMLVAAGEVGDEILQQIQHDTLKFAPPRPRASHGGRKKSSAAQGSPGSRVK